jgi:hypothetical protein
MTSRARGWTSRWADRRAALGGEPRGEGGSVLILALVFLLAVSLVVGGLADLATNDLNNTAAFTTSRSMQASASSVTDLAIEGIRYAPLLSTNQTLNASPPVPCWSSGSEPQLPTSVGPSVSVWCSTAWNPTSALTRVVTFSTCASSLSASQCAATPLLQAVVTFDDYPPGISVPTLALCVVYCGSSMTLNSWVWSPTLPTVTGINPSPATGPITGGTSVTLTGTGFVSGATVNFVDAAPGSNVIVPASGVTVNSSKSITAVSPAVLIGTLYYVTVTTPIGTSAYGPTFTYSLVAPIVLAISPATGSTAGGTSVTITGTGLVSGATVNLTEEVGGVAVSGPVVVSATSVTVSSPITITAITPSVTAGTTYFVTVSTPSGNSAQSSAAVFTYSPLTPTVTAISSTSGPVAGGTGMTVTGTGFVTGATVNFVKELLGIPTIPSVSIPATGVTVTGSTTINATSPAVTSGSTYYVTVTTPGGTSVYGPVFTYS